MSKIQYRSSWCVVHLYLHSRPHFETGRNLLFCNKYEAKALLLLPQVIHFKIICYLKFPVFRSRTQTLPFFIVWWFYRIEMLVEWFWLAPRRSLLRDIKYPVEGHCMAQVTGSRCGGTSPTSQPTNQPAQPTVQPSPWLSVGLFSGWWWSFRSLVIAFSLFGDGLSSFGDVFLV